MQTRRDQLHAYKFLNRRALAALVTGEPNVPEPPMRRLTVTTISGVMIAILIAVGFAVFGLIKPTTGDTWKAAGVIIVERQTGARYVYIDDVLHPVLNYSSAVLAISGQQQAHVVLVDASDLAGTTRGSTIGIDGIPDSLPPASELISSPWTACSQLGTTAANSYAATVTLHVGDDAGAGPLSPDVGVVIHQVQTTRTFLLWHGHRMQIMTSAVDNALKLAARSTVDVGTAFINAIPAGTALQAPTITALGQPGPAVGGRPTVVGQLVQTPDASQSWVVVSGGLAPLNPLPAALVSTVGLGADHPAIQATVQQANAAGALPGLPAELENQFSGLPETTPTLDSSAQQGGGLCAIYTGGAQLPTFAVPPSTSTLTSGQDATDSAQSKSGRADQVLVAPGRAAEIMAANGAATVFVLAEPGKKYPVSASAGGPDSVLQAFGYGGVSAVKLPAQVLALIPTGAALDPVAARLAVTG